MASNTNTLQDEDGDWSDWIELYNASSNAVNLEGWYLTDEAANLDKWAFPSNTLAPGAFLVVFASNKDRALAGAELHTNFRLAGNGEYLALVRPNGSTVEWAYSPAYPAQVVDASYGIASGVSTVLLVNTSAACRILVPTNNGVENVWMYREFGDGAWTSGVTGVGYDNTTNPPPNYRPQIGLTVSNLMYLKNETVYLRIPFTVSAPQDLDTLNLQMNFDDGFVAYLNGNEVASANVTAPLRWNSGASTTHDATNFVNFFIPHAADTLVPGTNLLAIQGLNRLTNSSDFLILPRLEAIEKPTPDNGLLRYFTLPTPGSANGTGATNVGPLIGAVTHTPSPPADADELFVTARITPTFGAVSTAELHYLVMFTNALATTPLFDDGLHGDGAAADLVYGAAIPASAAAAGEMIRYYLTAQDTNGVAGRWPLPDDPDGWLGTVVQNPALTNPLPVLHWFVADPAWHVITTNNNNRNWTNCYLFFSNRFFAGGQVRVRGNSSQDWRKPHFKFEFVSGHHFVWSTNHEDVEEFNLQSTYSDKAFVRQILGMETYRDSGAPYSECFPVRVQQNNAFYSVAIWLEQPGETYLERQGLDDDGALYKMYNQFTASSGSSVDKKTRLYETTNTDLAEAVTRLNPTNTALARQRYLFDQVDLPSMCSYLAATTLQHDNDHIGKNYYVYRDTEGDGEWTMLPWDKDLTFGRNYDSPPGSAGVLSDTIWASNDVIVATNLLRSPSHPRFGDSRHQKNDGPWNRFIDGIYTNAVTRNMYMRRLRTLMDQLLQPTNTPAAELRYENRIAELYAQMKPDVDLDRARWGNPYGSNQTIEAALDILTNRYLAVRRKHLFVNHSQATAATNDIPLAQPSNVVIGIGAVEFTPTNGLQDQEYVELRNTNSLFVDLSGWSLSNAVQFTFAPGTVIAAFSNLYVSPSLTNFRQRSVSPRSNESRFVVGPYDGHLSARGETLDLWNSNGVLVSSLTYTGAPSAQQQYLRVTELMYHPDAPADTNQSEDDFEFIELMNTGPGNLNLQGAHFTRGLEFVFTNSVLLAPSSLAVLVRNPTNFATRYDTNGVLIAGVFTNHLSNGGESIKLEDALNETILEFSYQDGWYPETDGGGYALHAADPLASYTNWESSAGWRAGRVYRGSPGRHEADVGRGLLINEALTHSDSSNDWIELWNPLPADVDLSGWYLSDEGALLTKYRMPAGTVLTAGAYRVFTEDDFNNATNPACLTPFALSELGEEIRLVANSGLTPTDYRDVQRFGAADREVPFARVLRCDSQAVFVAAAAASPGASNGAPRVGPVTISEIQYHPGPSGTEFIELRTTTNTLVDLFDPLHRSNTWKLAGAVDYTFGTNDQISGDFYAVVVPINPVTFRNLYGVPPLVQVFGPYSNALDNAGDRLQLLKPGDPETNGLVPYIVVDEVAYDDTPPWPTNADGSGRSIEKLVESSFGNDPCHWQSANVYGSPGTGSQLDRNSDGLPDNWSAQYFGTNAAAATDDGDGDRVDNGSEFIAGTSPADTGSVLQVRLQLSNEATVVAFEAQAATGAGYFGKERRYTLEWSTSLLDGAWSALATHSNLPGVNATVTYTNDAGNGEGYYRVRSRLDDLAP